LQPTLSAKEKKENFNQKCVLMTLLPVYQFLIAFAFVQNLTTTSSLPLHLLKHLMAFFFFFYLMSIFMGKFAYYVFMVLFQVK